MRSFATHIFNFHQEQLHTQTVAIALAPAVTLVGLGEPAKSSAGLSGRVVANDVFCY
jgi:hypothetical protein